MKNVRVFDAGNTQLDRYTVVYTNRYEGGAFYEARAMSADPFHPQGLSQMTSAMLGDHLGEEVEFDSLPPDCQKLVKSDLEGE